MTRHFTVRITAIFLILATPVLAADKRRAVAPHGPTLVTLTGTVTDSSTGAPVVQVAVSASGGQLLATTDTKGQFTTKLAPGHDTSLTFVRSGYQTLTTTVNISGDASRAFQLVSLPVTTLRTITGTTAQLDTDTIEFGYLAPFSGYVKDTKLNLCTSGGNAFTPDRSEIRKITGPVQLNDPACCSRGAIPAISVQLKTGTASTGGFVDACVGYTVDLIGRDHVTSQPVYFHFSNLAEVDFP